MTHLSYPSPSALEQPSDRRYVVAVVLSAIFGILGVHHFYLGRIAHGLFDLSLSVSALVLLMMGYPAWALLAIAIDYLHTFAVTFQLLVGACRDGQGRLVTYPGQKIGSPTAHER